MPLKLRCSQLPLVSICSAAAQPPAVQIKTDSAEARLGSAVHEVQAARINGAWPDVADVACKWRVDENELHLLCFLAWECWVGNETRGVEGVGKWFPGARTEVEMKAGPDELQPLDAGRVLTGHADIIAYVDGEARVADLKTGFADLDYEAQVRGYCFLAYLNAPGKVGEVETTRGCVVNVRGETADWNVWSADELWRWWDALVERLEAGANIYTPGLHCRYCPRYHECPAARSMLRASVGVVIESLGDLPADLTAAELVATKWRVKLVRTLCDDLDEALKARVANAGGRMATSDGTELVLEQQKRTKIRFAAAWRVIGEALQPEQYGEVFAVNKGALDRAVRAAAPRGDKGARVKEVYEALEKAGAVETTFVERLEVKRISPVPVTQQLEDRS